MIKLAWQGLHLERGVSQAGSYSSESDPRWGRLEIPLAKASWGATAHFQPIEPGDAWPPPMTWLGTHPWGRVPLLGSPSRKLELDTESAEVVPSWASEPYMTQRTNDGCQL